MKYWTELSGLETQIIRFGEMRSLFSVLSNGAEQSSEEDVRSALWYIEGSLTDIYQNLRNEFDDLWEAISDEETEELVEKIKNRGNHNWKNLDEVTRQWAASSVESK